MKGRALLLPRKTCRLVAASTPRHHTTCLVDRLLVPSANRATASTFSVGCSLLSAFATSKQRISTAVVVKLPPLTRPRSGTRASIKEENLQPYSPQDDDICPRCDYQVNVFSIPRCRCSPSSSGVQSAPRADLGNAEEGFLVEEISFACLNFHGNTL